MLVYIYIYIYIYIFFFFTRRVKDIFFAKQEIDAEKKQPDALDSYLENNRIMPVFRIYCIFYYIPLLRKYPIFLILQNT